MRKRKPVVEEINWEDDHKSTKTLICTVSLIEEKLRSFNNPYVGNKRKLLLDIFCFLEENNIEFSSVLDLFSGSSYVSMAMKLMDKKVVSNDLLSCSYLNALAFVKNKDTIITEKEKESLFEYVEDYPKKYIDYKYLNRLNEAEIAIISTYYDLVIKKWGHPLEGNIKSALAIACMQNYIIENCFVGGRLNSGQILASYEHRVNHPRNKGYSLFYNGINFSYKGIKYQDPIYPKDKNKHECYNMDAIELLDTVKPQVDFAYIDPPYGGSQSDYGYMYSILEEMLHCKPYEEIIKEKQGYKRYVDKKSYEESFDELMEKSSYIPKLLISYNNSSWSDIDNITKIIKRHRKDVIIKELNYDYNYRDNSKNDKAIEYLILVE